jgi:UDPglucose 6-dehydrogenase
VEGNTARIGIIGSGYVGLVAAACFAEIGHEVTCVDNDAAKIAALARGKTLIHERFLPELLARHRGHSLRFTTSIADAVHECEVLFIAVGTPTDEKGNADLSTVEEVVREIARELRGHNFSRKIIVEKSTVPVGTSKWIRRVMLEAGARDESFDVVCNPEFLREGCAVTDFLYPSRIVVGGVGESSERLRHIYAPLIEGEYGLRADGVPRPDEAQVPARFIATGAESAEVIKHASNAFLAMKISFINAVANVCEAVQADVEEVREGVGTDARIGSEFLKPGLGYGGSCFPKDLIAFRSTAAEAGYDFRLLEEVCRINQQQREHLMRKVHEALWTLKGKRLAVLGLAYKGGTDDVRESPAIAFIRMLLKEGGTVVAHDPAANARAREVFAKGEIDIAEELYDAAVDADALLILTDWEEFSQLDLERLRELMKQPVIVDGRNLYQPEFVAKAGFAYYSIGREARPRVKAATEVDKAA